MSLDDILYLDSHGTGIVQGRFIIFLNKVRLLLINIYLYKIQNNENPTTLLLIN